MNTSELKHMLQEVVENECLDMSDEFTNDEIVFMLYKAIQEIIVVGDTVDLVVFKADGKYFTESRRFWEARQEEGGCSNVNFVRIKNGPRRPMVSWSSQYGETGVDDDFTGNCKIIPVDFDDYNVGNLLSALNRAWYLCNN